MPLRMLTLERITRLAFIHSNFLKALEEHCQLLDHNSKLESQSHYNSIKPGVRNSTILLKRSHYKGLY